MTTNTNTEALRHLQTLGFSEYEAKAYLGLLQNSPMTGYQLAKSSGIPRPNIYPVLDRLQQRGAVLRIEVEKGGVEYSALPASEMLARLARGLESDLAGAREALKEVKPALPAEYVWNIQGYSNVEGRARALVDGAKRTLLAGVWAEESSRLSSAFAAAQARGVATAILCIQGCADECGNCRGHVYRYQLSGAGAARWLIAAADDRELLVGQVLPNGDAVAVVTRHEALVAVGSGYLRNSIAVAEIVRSIGPRLRDLVDEKTLETLQGAWLATGGVPLLDHFLSAANRGIEPS